MIDVQKQSPLQILFIAAALATLMIMTRGDLLGATAAFTLHDASWAVFLLGGVLLRQVRWLAAFALLAFALDYIALCNSPMALGECLRPSYIPLLITWCTLWFSGRLLTHWLNNHQWPAVGIGAVVATSASYLISNAGFYLLSGFYRELTLAGFTKFAAPHFLLALTTTLVYFFLGLTLVALKAHFDANTREARIEP